LYLKEKQLGAIASEKTKKSKYFFFGAVPQWKKLSGFPRNVLFLIARLLLIQVNYELVVFLD
jgi:hypothetical protein